MLSTQTGKDLARLNSGAEPPDASAHPAPCLRARWTPDSCWVPGDTTLPSSLSQLWYEVETNFVLGFVMCTSKNLDKNWGGESRINPDGVG